MPEFTEHKPFFLQLDNDELVHKPDEALFNKNWTFDNNKNKGLSDGTNNPSNVGQNQWVLTPHQSNVEIPNELLPQGYNKSSAFESIVSNEIYHFNHNENGNHGIYVTSGETLTCRKVIIDSELQFSDNQEAFIANHRVILRVVYNEQKQIIEKFLLATDGNTWQKWVNVEAAIATNGFDANAFPYWGLQPPHFDRRELVEYPVRPPMIAITTEPIANTEDDAGKPNRQIEKAFRASYKRYNTDGRETPIAPWSLPFYAKKEDFLNNPELIPKKTRFTLDAGSPLTEKIEIYIEINGIWYLYDTINGFANSENVLGTPYWLRTNKWADYNYDPVQNTIEYIFDNTKVGQIVDQLFITRIQNDIPIRNVAMSPIGDATLLANNEKGFNNFGKDTTNKFDISVLQRTTSTCNVQLRNLTLYAYTGLMGDHVDDIFFISQVGYFNGEDKQFRFGGLQLYYDDDGTKLRAEVQQSKDFLLDYADKKSLRCYLKGTPYYADGVWYKVSASGIKIRLEDDLDISSLAVQALIYNVYAAQGYFICQFDFQVPAGIYTATLGRHNVLTTEDWRSQSTYIMGIADSTDTSTFTFNGETFTAITPDALVNTKKEIEVDCRADNVDVWGNGADLFYVFAPSPLYEGAWGSDDDLDAYVFIEGYLQESPDASIGMELYPYTVDGGMIANRFSGFYTDKNGFYFQYAGRSDANTANVGFFGNRNCVYSASVLFETELSGDHRGWHPDTNLYWSNYNGGIVGSCNRMIIIGKITNIDGTIGYSNISVSIDYGDTAVTNDEGEFTLIAHNGLETPPERFLIVNAGGDFVITLENCDLLDKYEFTEPVCISIPGCAIRQFTLADIAVKVEGGGQQSIKTESTIPVLIIGADLAGRVTYANLLENVEIPSFMDLGEVVASYLAWSVSSLPIFPDDIKWVTFAVGKDLNRLKYVQWVGDNIKYLDGAGNVTTDISTAKLVQISITSLLNANIASNFSLLANYQFVEGDRVRIFDNGTELLDTATYGDPIDLQIVGTTYNQAAINAGLLPSTTSTTTPVTTGANIIVEYNSKLDILNNKTGFWVEIYSPQQINSELPCFEAGRWYPVVNNQIAIYTGGGVSAPVYTYPTSGTIDYWDAYFLRRNINIQGIGNKYFNHPFESPNITDNWGKDVSSGGRPNKVNPFAKRRWYIDSTIKSDDFSSEGIRNGLGTFRAVNEKDFKGFGRGGFVAVISQFSIILFICENDYFITDYNFNYIYANAQGVQVANLSNNLSEPHQKIGSNYGCAYEHTGTIVAEDKLVFWYDVKNGQFVLNNYNQAIPISDKGIKAYLIEKSVFISRWNLGKANKDKFDVVAGLDYQNSNIYLTFRPRRNNSLTALSFINNRRDLSIKHQETLVYNIQTERWTRTVGFTPEAYISLRGNGSVQEFFTFASGKIYYHNNTPKDSGYCHFYGVYTGLVMKIVFNDAPDIVKYLKTIAYQCLGMKLYVDLIYNSQKNSFSYIPLNHFKTKKKVNYGAVLRDMSSYPNYKQPTWSSILLDGMKKMFGQFVIIRIVGSMSDRGGYAELSGIFKRFSQSGNNKK